MGQRRGASVQTCAEENKARHLGHSGRASMAAAAAVQEAEAPCLQSFELCETELVAQYASSNGQGKAASDAVDECLRALEDLDSLLLKASRKDPSASVEVMRSKIIVALGALDNLLQTVPSAVMDKGKAIAVAYRTPADGYEEGNGAELDPKLKQLQDIR